MSEFVEDRGKPRIIWKDVFQTDVLPDPKNTRMGKNSWI
jgi:hypothetical protein